MLAPSKHNSNSNSKVLREHARLYPCSMCARNRCFDVAVVTCCRIPRPLNVKLARLRHVDEDIEHIDWTYQDGAPGKPGVSLVELLLDQKRGLYFLDRCDTLVSGMLRAVNQGKPTGPRHRSEFERMHPAA